MIRRVVFAALLLAVSSQFSGCGPAVPTIDATSDATFAESKELVMAPLSGDDKKAFEEAWDLLGYDVETPEDEKIANRKSAHGLTAAQIIERGVFNIRFAHEALERPNRTDLGLAGVFADETRKASDRHWISKSPTLTKRAGFAVQSGSEVQSKPERDRSSSRTD